MYPCCTIISAENTLVHREARVFHSLNLQRLDEDIGGIYNRGRIVKKIYVGVKVMSALPLQDISLSNIASVFSPEKSVPHSMSEYYMNGTNVKETDTNPNIIPSSGAISFGNFRGASKASGSSLPLTTVAYYDIRNASSYAGTGTLVYDLSASGATINLNAPPGYGSTPGYISVTSTTRSQSLSTHTFSVSSGFSMEALFRLTSNNFSSYPNIFTYKVLNDWGLQMQINPNGTPYIYNGATNTSLSVSRVLSLNKWYHMIFTSTRLVYINGVSSVPSSFNASITNAARYIGIGMAGTGPGGFNSPTIIGDIAMIKFHSKALSQTEITSAYNALLVGGNPYALS